MAIELRQATEYRSGRDVVDRILLGLIGLIILVLLWHSRAYWLLFPPNDPDFSWSALHARRDLDYVEIDRAVAHWEGPKCITSLHAPNGRIYQIKTCSLVDLAQDWRLKVRLACRYHVDVDFLGRFVRGWHDDCVVLDLIYLENR